MALHLARRAEGQTSPNPMVGAVLEKSGRIIATGYHRRAGLPHAEIVALTRAGEKARGASLYVTLEPCAHHGRTPPCTEAIIAAGVRRVVAAMRDPNPLVAGRGFNRLRQAGIEVVEGVLEAEARALNRFFVCYHEKRRPYVIVKWAMSADGRTSTDSGESKWITGETARNYAHRLRARVDAIAVGIKTVLKDDPQLTARLPRRNRVIREALRLVFDPAGDIPLEARVLSSGSPDRTVLLTTSAIKPAKERRLLERGHQVWKLPAGSGGAGQLDLMAVVIRLHRENVLSLLVEGGRELAGSFFAAGLVDYVTIFMAPKIIGGLGHTSPLKGWGVSKLDDSLSLINPQWRRLGPDICLEGEVKS